MSWIYAIFQGFWEASQALGPYLLLGLVVAGVLHVLLPRRLVEKHLSSRGFASVFKATLLGMPMPLCSCGVIPVATSLRKQGSSKGATVSFLIATPQSGADNLLATYGMLGPVFAVAGLVVTFVTGLLAGFITDRVDRDTPSASDASNGDTPAPNGDSPILRALRHACITLPASFGRSILFGLLLAGLISTFIPDNALSGTLGGGATEILVAMLFGVPIYVCATGSIPIAASLLAAGLSPGAALAFLITGPATNVTTLSTVWGLLGRKITVIYLSTIMIVSLAAGLLLNEVLRESTPLGATLQPLCHPPTGASHVATGSAIVLLLLLLRGAMPTRGRSG